MRQRHPLYPKPPLGITPSLLSAVAIPLSRVWSNSQESRARIDRDRVWELEEGQVESHHTFGDISDVIFVVLGATVPGHVIHGERLVGAQHDHLNGT